MNQEQFTAHVRGLTKPLGHKMNLIHAQMGVSSEAGEITDALKAALIYGKPLDLINIVEEAGDLLFFLEMLLAEFDLTLSDAAEANITKLGIRYQAGYSDTAAKERKRELEYAALVTSVGSKLAHYKVSIADV